MIRFFIFVTIFVFLTSFQNSTSQSLCHGFAPETNLRVPVDAKEVSSVSEQDVKDIIDVLYSIYNDKFETLNRTLFFNLQWDEDQFNAYTNLYRGRAQVVITGGMIRHPLISKDGIALVLCHELGHHLAGKPKHKVYRFFSIFASAEGQADYFATLKCLRSYFDIVPKQDEDIDLPVEIHSICEEQFSDEKDVDHCLRSNMAGLTMARVLNSLKKEPLPNLGLLNSDQTVVKHTFRKHPNPQCRLDTYFAGAVCSIDQDVPIDIYKDGTGQCTRNEGATAGVRPLCWYHPAR